MTLDRLRHEVLRAKRDELTSSVRSRKRKLRDLYAVATAPAPHLQLQRQSPSLTQLSPPPSAAIPDDALIDEGEAAFLDANDIWQGRFFLPSTLPPPPPPILTPDLEPALKPANVSTPPTAGPPSSPPTEAGAPDGVVAVGAMADGPTTPPAAIGSFEEKSPDAVKVSRSTADVRERSGAEQRADPVTPPEVPIKTEGRQPLPRPRSPARTEGDAGHGRTDADADGDGNDAPPSFDSRRPSSAERPQEAPVVGDLVQAALSMTRSVANPVPEGPSPKRRKRAGPEPRRWPATVVFAHRPASTSTRSHATSLVRIKREEAHEDDYVRPAAVAQAYSPPRAPQLDALLASARKTLSTADLYTDVYEQRDARVLNQVNRLQANNQWPLRQIERVPEPARAATHWDVLLDHMRWMQVDFREEKKWKMVAARRMAQWCAAWISSNAEDRTSLQVRVKRPSTPKMGRDAVGEPSWRETAVTDGERSPGCLGSDRLARPPLSASAAEEDDPMPDAVRASEPARDPLHLQPVASLFAMDGEEVNLSIQTMPSGTRVLQELPMDEPVQQMSAADMPLDRDWQLPMLPVSRYVTEGLVTVELDPSRKRKRSEVRGGDERSERRLPPLPPLPPQTNDVALFFPEHQPIRDRIHAAQNFRPPSEFGMPSQSFYQSRQSSQWTAMDDSKLRGFVKKHAYNWSLVASLLASPSMFSSAADRRTPWECFERWVSLEGLPADMQRSSYFRTWYSRLEAGQQQVPAEVPLAAPDGHAPPAPSHWVSTQAYRIDRRKQSRHLALFDAMRKLAKKRETTFQKQQQAVGMAAMRRANIDPTQTRAPVYTPRDFSKIKYEREVKQLERAEAYRQQVIAQQRAALHQRAAAQANAPAAMANGVAAPHARNGVASADGLSYPVLPPSAMPVAHPGPAAYPHAARPPPSLPVPAPNMALYGNGVTGVLPPVGAAAMNHNNPLRMKAVPQAHMHSSLPGPARHAPPVPNEVRMLMENTRIQQEQRRLLVHQQQHQGLLNFHGPAAASPAPIGPPPSSASPMMNHAKPATGGGPVPMPGPMPMPGSPAMLAALQAAVNANSIHHVGTLAAGAGHHPHLPPHAPPQSLSSGLVPAINSITHQIKARHPNASPEQIKKMTNEQLAAQYQQRLSQSAMNAAAGAGGIGLGAGAHHAGHAAGPPHLGLPNGASSAAAAAAAAANLVNPQQQLYAQMIRAQQASQSKAAAALGYGVGAAGPGGIGAVPGAGAGAGVGAGLVPGAMVSNGGGGGGGMPPPSRGSTLQAPRAPGGGGPGPGSGPGPGPAGLPTVALAPNQSPRPPQAQMAGGQ
ncbi:MAG: chromatin modification- protein VID21 [Phylliscum demangeonii]|nr:MAG: chromatin modification- protein VID21 [Phylliscum demangeonii]